MDYSQHFSTLKTPQQERARADQVENNAGGFVFALDKWARLDRWLILGSDGASYYASEKKLTVDNAKTVIECIAEDGPRVVAIIVAISDAGRAPKNDPAIFALAMAAGAPDQATRRAALVALPKVCRIGTHLFHFARDVEGFRRWGRGLRTAIAAWYNDRSAESVAHQAVKYQQRDGWAHRDLLRLSHAVPRTPAHDATYRWIVDGIEGLAKETKRNKPIARSLLPAILEAFEEGKTADKPRLLALIREHNLTHEMIPNEHKGDPAVWEALLERMPLGALVRNLGKMSAIGLFKPLGDATGSATKALLDADAIRKARLHPIAILSALRVYQQGHGEKGKLTWSPERAIVDALDEAFYLAFQAIEPTHKKHMLAIDVSGSMDGGLIAGCPGISPRVGAAAMAMATARSEPHWHAVGFTSGAAGEWKFGAGKSMHSGYASALTPLTISPRQRLDDVITTMQRLPMGGTDCAVPMLYAAAQEIEVDTFVVFTDSETWAGTIHPFQALKAYREKMGRPAKLVVVGMVANEFTVADPSDAGMMDVVGFDTAAPAVMADFSRQELRAAKP